ncbi:hypothetical protein LCGC14_1414450 [marine sediment metagenome]|uniref:DUF1737 domain-containing protein n=1 Tax=marine sediment metagenome TaxID=412755 RepID=A0A0F9KEE3_9ZZZZ
MKEYTVLNGTRKDIITDLNELAVLGWMPTHFAMAGTEEVDTFGVLLEREKVEPKN